MSTRSPFHWLRRSRCSLWVAAVCTWLGVFLHSGHATAQEPPEGPRIWLEPAPDISVLTFGPGDEAFLKFGHNAIRVRYPGPKAPDLVYNFGTFRFDDPLLILDFLTGKFRYWLSVSSFESTVGYYRNANRSVVEQELNIGRPTAWDIALALRENAKPENRYYLYDYYRDNCSTRVRDVLDQAMKGVLEQRTSQPGSMTLRDHTLRLVADDFWLYVGLDIAMGPFIDQPETRWSEMFLPEKIEQALSGISFSGAHGTHQLVKKRVVWHEASGRPALRKRPPERTLGFFQGGAVIGAAIAFLGWEAYHRRRDWARYTLSILIALFGLVTGILGLLFAGLWALTNHEVTYHNENLLQCAPWALGFTFLAWGVARNRARAIDYAHRLALAGLAASATGLVAKLLPFMEQHNERVIAFFLPVWMGVFVALRLTRLRAQRWLTVPVEEKAEEPLSTSDDREEHPSVDPKKRPSTAPPPQAAEDEEDDVPAPSGQPAPA